MSSYDLLDDSIVYKLLGYPASTNLDDYVLLFNSLYPLGNT